MHAFHFFATGYAVHPCLLYLGSANAVPHWAQKGHGFCKSEFNDEIAMAIVARLLRSM
jgi:hypothetical protein